MEKSANTIGKAKFQSLSTRQQHHVFVVLAEEALAAEAFDAFFVRYEELHQWALLDRYQPPAWLTPSETIQASMDFHRLFGELPQKLAEPKPQLWQATHQVEIVVDQVRTPHNIGSLLRLIDNFGFQRLVHASPWLRWDHPRLARAARGAQAWIPIHYESDLRGYLQQCEVPVFALESDNQAMDLASWSAPKQCVLVLGNESYGVSKAIRACCDGALRIPMAGFKQSMNVTHALAVVAQSWRERQALACHESPTRP